jgi:hypothetical protein
MYGTQRGGVIGNYLRFMLPGVSAVILLMAAFFISDTGTVFRMTANPCRHDNIEIVLAVLGLFLSCGAVGYLLANVYLVLYNSRLMDRAAVDHRPLLRELSDDVVLRDAKGQVIEPLDSNLSRGDAWVLVAELSHSHLGSPESPRGVSRVVNRLANSLHLLGASAVGVVAAGGVWAALHFWAVRSASHTAVDHLVPVILLAVVLFFLTRAYAQTRRALQTLVNSETARLVRTVRASTESPVELFLAR